MYSMKIRYPVLYRMLTWIIGATIMGGGTWLLFPGAYRIGMWFSNSVMNWEIQGIHYGPGGWMIGIALLLVPVGFFFLAGSFGRWIVSFWD